jgi:hypothetical protein
MIIAFKILVGKFEGMRPQEKPGFKFEDNIKMDLKVIAFRVVDWMYTLQVMCQWRVDFRRIMNFLAS